MTDPAAAQVAVHLVDGRVRLTTLRSSHFLSPRPLLVDGTRARIALVGLCATLLSGDDLRIEIDVGAGVDLELVEPAGTVAYNAKGGCASWSATITVAEGSSLIWAAASFVVSAGADVRRETKIILGDSAKVLFRETLIMGRSGESGGRLRAHLEAHDPHQPLLIEDLDLTDAETSALPGILGDNRVLATAVILGVRPEPSSNPHVTHLAGPGALARSLSTDAHLGQAVMEDTWRRWSALISIPITLPDRTHRHGSASD